jgi:hypothetical protein
VGPRTSLDDVQKRKLKQITNENNVRFESRSQFIKIKFWPGLTIFVVNMGLYCFCKGPASRDEANTASVNIDPCISQIPPFTIDTEPSESAAV